MTTRVRHESRISTLRPAFFFAVSCSLVSLACTDGARGSCPDDVPRCDGEVLVECGRSGEVLPRNETSRFDCGAMGLVCVVEDGIGECVLAERETCDSQTSFTRCNEAATAVESCGSVGMWTAWDTCVQGAETCVEDVDGDGVSIADCALDPLEPCGDSDDDFLATCRDDWMVLCDNDLRYMTGDRCLDGCRDNGDSIDCDPDL